MKQRLSSRRRTADPVLEPSIKPGSAAPQIILGVDPSIRGTGYGLIRSRRSQAEHIVSGTIACPRTWERSRCLKRISLELRHLVEKNKPAVCVIEGVFYAQNMQTAIAMGEARGAAISAVAGAGLEIYEIATRKVKQAIVGYGAAQKIAVAKMVQRMLGLTDLPEPDAADALALALTFAQEHNRPGLGRPGKI